MRKLTALLLAAAMLTLSGCGKKADTTAADVPIIAAVSSDETEYTDFRARLAGTIEALDSDGAMSAITGFIEQGADTEKVRPIVSQELGILCQNYSPYYVYEYIMGLRDALAAALPDSGIDKSIDQLLDDNGNKIALAFMDGTWECTDGSGLAGARVEVSYPEDDFCIGTLAESKGDYSAKDIIWQEMSGYDRDTLNCDLLTYNNGSPSYTRVIVSVDYENDAISIALSDDEPAVQTWKKISD